MKNVKEWFIQGIWVQGLFTDIAFTQDGILLSIPKVVIEEGGQYELLILTVYHKRYVYSVPDS